MVDIKDAAQIRGEKLTYQDSILNLDNLINLQIQKAWSVDKLINTPELLAVEALLLRKHNMVSLKASFQYRQEVLKNKWMDAFGPGVWSRQDNEKFDSFKQLMFWDARMIKEYRRLNIVEPSDFVDWVGTTDQAVEEIYYLLGKLPYKMLDEIKSLVDMAKLEKHCIEDSLPEELLDG